MPTPSVDLETDAFSFDLGRGGAIQSCAGGAFIEYIFFAMTCEERIDGKLNACGCVKLHPAPAHTHTYNVNDSFRRIEVENAHFRTRCRMHYSHGRILEMAFGCHTANGKSLTHVSSLSACGSSQCRTSRVNKLADSFSI